GLPGTLAADSGVSASVGVAAGPLCLPANRGGRRAGLVDLGSVARHVDLDRNWRGLCQRYCDWNAGVAAPEAIRRLTRWRELSAIASPAQRRRRAGVWNRLFAAPANVTPLHRKPHQYLGH